MKKLFQSLKTLFRRLARKISLFLIGSGMVMGSLLGVKRKDKGEFDTSQLWTIGWMFILGMPVLLVFFSTITIPIWAGILILLLMLVNLDEALMLLYLFSEHGVEVVVNAGDYREWIQELYLQQL